MDNLHDPDSAVAGWSGHFVYHGRPDSYFARHCDHSGAGKPHSGAESRLELSTLELEINYPAIIA